MDGSGLRGRGVVNDSGAIRLVHISSIGKTLILKNDLCVSTR